MEWDSIEEQLGALPIEALPGAIGELARLQALAEARLLGSGRGEEEEDRLLTVDEAAKILNLPKDAVYRRADDFPFTVRLGRRLRFSLLGLQKFLTDCRQ